MIIQKHIHYLVLCFTICVNADVQNLQNAAGVYSKCIKNGYFAITFDDGISSNTESVLDVLKAKGVRATFFINGDNFSNINDPVTQDIMRRIIGEGHQIGSHTWSHIDLTDNQNLEIIQKEMLVLEDKVKEILGFKMSIMRPPYGSLNDSVLEIIHSGMKYSVVMWSLDTSDWANQANTNISFQAYIDTMGYATNVNSSFIALHHDFADGSAFLAGQAIDYVLQKGFTPVTISECLGIPDDNSGVGYLTRKSMCFMVLLHIFVAMVI